MLAALGSAFAGALVAIWLRKLSSSEHSASIGIYYNGLGSLTCFGWVLWSGWLMPGPGDFWLLAPFEYLAMVFAALVGYVFWGEVPILTTWIGAAIIAASGLFIFKRQASRGRPPAAERKALE